ncbi:MAG: PAS domain S-box protein [Planctomycetota bacterium]
MDRFESEWLEEGLGDGQDRYEQIVRAAGEGIRVSDAGGRMLFVNSRLADLLGHDPRELLGQSALDLVFPEDRSAALEEFKKGWLERCSSRESRFRRRDGTELWAIVSSSMIGGPEGQPLAILEILTDITERKKAEQALHDSEARSKLLADVAERLLRIEDGQTTVDEIGRAVMQHLGCDCFLSFLADETGTLHLNTCAGIPAGVAGHIDWLDGRVAIATEVAGKGEGVVVENIQHGDDPRATLLRPFGLQAYACHPLLAPHAVPGREATQPRGCVLGTLSFGSKSRPTFDAGELELLKSVAGQMAVAMQRLHDRKALLRAKQDLERTFDAVPDLITVLDERFRVVRANTAMAQRLGLTPEECRGKICYQVVHGTDQPPANCPHARSMADGQDHTAEVHEDRLDGDFVVSTTPIADEHGRRVGSVHVARDVTTRLRAERALRESQAQLQTILENLTEGLVVATLDGQLLHWNRAALEIHGFASLDEVRRPLQSFTEIFELATMDGTVLPLQQWPLARILRGEPLRDLELRIRRVSGDWQRIFRYGGALVQISQGQPLLAVVTVSDITERKRAETALREREQRLRQTHELLETITESTQELIAALDTQFRYTFVNNAFRQELWQLTGREMEIGMSMLDLLAHMPEEQRTTAAQWGRALKGETINETTELGDRSRYRRTYSVRIAPLRDADGVIAGAGQIATDVTEQMRAKEALRQASEQRLLALEAANLGAWDYDFAAGTVYWDERCRLMWGVLEGDQMDYVEAVARIHPDDRDATNEAVKQAIAGATDGTYHREFRIIWPDGTVHWIASHGRVYFEGEGEDRRAVRFLGANRDITEEKRAEQALRESREDLNRAQAVSHTGSWRLDVRRNELVWSEETHRIFGIPQGTPLTYEAFLNTVHPEDRNYVDRKWKDSLRGAPYDIEHRIVVGSTVKWVREKAGLEFDRNGSLLGGFGTTQDITERKRAAQELERLNQDLERRVQERTAELRASETKFRTLAEQSPSMIFIDRGGRLVYANEVCERMMGYTRAEMSAPDFDFATLCAPESAALVKARFAEQMSGEELGPCEIALLTRQGARIDAILSTRLVDYEGTRSILGLLTDITAHSEAERLRLAQEERLRHLSARLVTAQDQEQARIAQGLHDDVAQLLTAASIKLALARTSGSPGEFNQALDAVDELIDDANERVRSLSFEMASSTLCRLGLTDAIEELCECMTERYGVRFDLQTAGATQPLDDATATVLFKAVRELLFNVVKHAGVKRAGVLLRRVEGRVEITVEDHGRGFPSPPGEGAMITGGGLGLFSIRERLADLGGRIQIESEPGVCTRVTVWAPVRKE